LVSLGYEIGAYEHMYLPIRQTQTEKYRYIQRNTILGVIKHIVIELAQFKLLTALCSGIKTVFMQSSHLKIINDQNTSCSKPDLRYKRL